MSSIRASFVSLTVISVKELTNAEIDEIDVAGALGARRITARTYLQRAIAIAMGGAVILATCSYLGIDVL